MSNDLRFFLLKYHDIFWSTLGRIRIRRKQLSSTQASIMEQKKDLFLYDCLVSTKYEHHAKTYQIFSRSMIYYLKKLICMKYVFESRNLRKKSILADGCVNFTNFSLKWKVCGEKKATSLWNLLNFKNKNERNLSFLWHVF